MKATPDIERLVCHHLKVFINGCQAIARSEFAPKRAPFHWQRFARVTGNDVASLFRQFGQPLPDARILDRKVVEDIVHTLNP